MNQEEVIAKKRDMLRNMLAGVPTKETQAVMVKTQVYSDTKNIGNIDQYAIQEMVERMPVPPKPDGVLLPGEFPPIISEEATLALMQGKKPQNITQPYQSSQRRQIIENQDVDDYWMGGGTTQHKRYVSPDQERDFDGGFNVHEELRKSLEKKAKDGNISPRRSVNENRTIKTGNNEYSEDDLADVIEDIVYMVLGRIINDAVKRKLSGH